MHRISYLIYCALAIFGFVNNCAAKDWRGITPLQSTKRDVVRLLRSTANANELRSRYRLENEDVYIVFSGRQFCNLPTVRPRTVLLIEVTPRRNLELADLKSIEESSLSLALPLRTPTGGDAPWEPHFFESLAERTKAANISNLRAQQLLHDDLEVRFWYDLFEIISGVVIRRTGREWSASWIHQTQDHQPSLAPQLNLNAPRSGWERCGIIS